MYPSDLCCTQDDRPFEQLFKAVWLIRDFAEFEEECGSLTKKLTALFNDVPEKEGVKSYGNIRYFSNGLCEMYSTGNIIVLPSWERQFEAKDVRMQKRFEQLRKETNSFVVAQVKSFMGLKMPTKKIPIIECLQKLDEVENLIKENTNEELNKTLFRTKEEIKDRIQELYLEINQFIGIQSHFDYDNSLIPTLDNERLAKLSLLIKSNNSISSNTDNIMRPVYKQELLPRYPRRISYNLRWRDQLAVSYMNQLLETISKIQDEHAVKVLKKMGIIA